MNYTCVLTGIKYNPTPQYVLVTMLKKLSEEGIINPSRIFDCILHTMNSDVYITLTQQ